MRNKEKILKTKRSRTQGLETCREALLKNNFEVYIANSSLEARDLVLEKILPEVSPSSVSWGDSQTLFATGLISELKKLPGLTIFETFDEKGCAAANWEETCREGVTSDLFFAGSNAITLDGKLINLDMVGNRVGGIAFGPKVVVILVGRNKLTENLDAAMKRIRDYAAPENAKRNNMKTPCAKTGECADCNSPERICNTWVINEKSFPKGRIKVILIDEDLGL
jgi:hypothetical protein